MARTKCTQRAAPLRRPHPLDRLHLRVRRQGSRSETQMLDSHAATIGLAGRNSLMGSNRSDGQLPPHTPRRRELLLRISELGTDRSPSLGSRGR